MESPHTPAPEYAKGVTWLMVGGLLALLVALVAALAANWQRLDPWPLYGYAALFAGYLAAERRVRRLPDRAGQRTHAGLRVALSAGWWLLMLGAPLEYALTARQGTAISLIGVCLTIGGAALRVWGVATLGRFYSGHIETWDDQQVVERGPYHLIRHPGYAGSIVQAVGMPLVLNAYLSLILAALVVALFVRRLMWEEAALAESLPGYAGYMRRTRRLIPGVW